MTQRKFLVLTSPQSFDELDISDLPAGAAGVLTSEQFTGDGVEDTFTLSQTPASSYAIVTVNGAQVTTYGISGDDVVFTTPPDDDAEIIVSYVYGGGLVSPPTAADVSVSPAVEGQTDVQAALETLEGAMHTIGPFTVNYNDANVLTTGVPLWTPEAGYVVYNMWMEITTAFTGSGGWSNSHFLFLTANDVLAATAAQALMAFTGSADYVDSGVDVANHWIADMLSIQSVAGAGYDEQWFPARMKNTTPILLKLIPNAGTMTAGQLKVYAMVGELA